MRGMRRGHCPEETLQKFVIGREIMQKPEVLVVNQPTWGVDASAAASIRQALFGSGGRRVRPLIVISQDLDELMEISTRFAALNEGRLSEPRRCHRSYHRRDRSDAGRCPWDGGGACVNGWNLRNWKRVTGTMIRLEKRPTPSKVWSWATPIWWRCWRPWWLADVLFGAFWARIPVEVIRTIFWDPILGEFAFYYRGQLLVKAGPLILIAIGSVARASRPGIWNIGAEGQYIMGAIFGAAVGLAFYPMEARWLIFPLDDHCGRVWGISFGR